MKMTKKDLLKALSTMIYSFAGAAIYYFIYTVNPSNAQSFAVLCVIYIMYREHKNKLKNVFLR